MEVDRSAIDVVREWFRPPRAHGDIDDARVVSFLELFYDLVFVVLVAQIAHTLADHPTWVGVRDFVLVFVLVWFAWINGTMYHEVHGGEDGRSRMYIFAQMAILVVLAVFASHAADDPADGRGFAITYAVLLVLIGLQWYGVRRVDAPEMRPMATRYLFGLAVMAAVVAVSALVNDQDLRLILWAGAILAAPIVGSIAQSMTHSNDLEAGLTVTESMAERFGLFTILVLGEVVVGVVDGLSEAEHNARTIVTGVLALSIGFGFWWNYFDFIGRREPDSQPGKRYIWAYGHLPLAMSIGAAGAGMVGLVEHAADGRTPAGIAWLLAGATTAAALSLAILVSTMPSLPGRRMIPATLVGVAVLALVLGALRPAPWALALLLYLGLSAVWLEAFIRHAKQGQLIVDA